MLIKHTRQHLCRGAVPAVHSLCFFFLVSTGVLQAQEEGGGGPAVSFLSFRRITGVVSAIEDAGVAPGIMNSPAARRLGLKRYVQTVKQKVRELERFLDVKLTDALQSIGDGEGHLFFTHEGNAPVFVVELRPAEPVPFPLIIKRFAARDRSFAVLRKHVIVNGRPLWKCRFQDAVFFCVPQEERFLVSTSRSCVEKALRGTLVAENAHVFDGEERGVFFKGVFFAGRSLRELSPELKRTGIKQVSMKVAIEDDRFEVTGSAVFIEEIAAALNKIVSGPPENSSLMALLPEGRLAGFGMRLDYQKLFSLFLQQLAPGERRVARQKLRGFSSLFLGGRRIEDLLSGIGPEVLVAVSDGGRRGQVFDLAFLGEIQTRKARQTLDALGRALCSISQIQGSAVEQESADGCSFYTGGIDRQRFSLGVREDRFCFSTSTSLCRTILAASRHAEADSKRFVDKVPPFHLFWGVDLQVLGSWLDRNRGFLLGKTGRGGGAQHHFSTNEEITSAVELCSLLQYGGGAVQVTETGIEFALELSFADND